MTAMSEEEQSMPEGSSSSEIVPEGSDGSSEIISSEIISSGIMEEMMAGIDRFLADPGIGVVRELPRRRGGLGMSENVGDEGVEEIELTDPDSLGKAVDVVERYVMGGQFAAREADDGGDEDAVTGILQDMIDYLFTLPQAVLVGVLMELSDAAAGMYAEINRAEDRAAVRETPEGQ